MKTIQPLFITKNIFVDIDESESSIVLSEYSFPESELNKSNNICIMKINYKICFS